MCFVRRLSLAFSRSFAFENSIMGAKAVDLLLEGKSNRVVGYRGGEYVDFDINEALNMQKGIPAYQYEIARELAL